MTTTQDHHISAGVVGFAFRFAANEHPLDLNLYAETLGKYARELLDVAGTIIRSKHGCDESVEACVAASECLLSLSSAAQQQASTGGGK